MGEDKAFDWWARMRANGVKVSKGWSEAYYTEFSHNGGARPLVVSYASSPAAEMFYSKTKLTEPPTGSLFHCRWRIPTSRGRGTGQGWQRARAAAAQFVEFLRSAAVQQERCRPRCGCFPARCVRVRGLTPCAMRWSRLPLTARRAKAIADKRAGSG
jgi:ABC transporter substrate-binding protein (ThiB subfamily)